MTFDKATYKRQWRLSNPEKQAASSAKWYAKNKGRAAESARKWREANPDRVAFLALRTRLKQYGLSVEQYEQMLADQGGACAVCGAVPDRTLHVDHCHTSGRVRGLLCSECNTGIGLMCEDPERLRRAAEYLRLYRGS